MEKVVKASAFSIIVFAVILALIIGSRMDQNTIALLGGTFVGLAVAVPCTAVITFVAMRRRYDDVAERSGRYAAHLPQNPPQYWVVPPQPHYQQAPQAQLNHAQAGMMWQPPAEYMLPAARRKFYVIGETGEVRDVDDTQSQAYGNDEPAVF